MGLLIMGMEPILARRPDGKWYLCKLASHILNLKLTAIPRKVIYLKKILRGSVRPVPYESHPLLRNQCYTVKPCYMELI